MNVGDIFRVHDTDLAVGLSDVETNHILTGVPFIVVLGENDRPLCAVNISQAVGLIEALSKAISMAVYG